MKPNDGEPAFPLMPEDGAPVEYRDMSLRDFFAAAAMPAMIRLIGARATKDNVEDLVLKLPEAAYAIADGMIAEREKERSVEKEIYERERKIGEALGEV